MQTVSIPLLFSIRISMCLYIYDLKIEVRRSGNNMLFTKQTQPLFLKCLLFYIAVSAKTRLGSSG